MPAHLLVDEVAENVDIPVGSRVGRKDVVVRDDDQSLLVPNLEEEGNGRGRGGGGRMTKTESKDGKKRGGKGFKRD